MEKSQDQGRNSLEPVVRESRERIQARTWMMVFGHVRRVLAK